MKPSEFQRTRKSSYTHDHLKCNTENMLLDYVPTDSSKKDSKIALKMDSLIKIDNGFIPTQFGLDNVERRQTELSNECIQRQGLNSDLEIDEVMVIQTYRKKSNNNLEGSEISDKSKTSFQPMPLQRPRNISAAVYKSYISVNSEKDRSPIRNLNTDETNRESIVSYNIPKKSFNVPGN